MITPECLAALASILAAVAWPFVVFCLLITFKSDIRELLKRLREAEFPWGKTRFFRHGDIPIDAQRPGLEAKSVGKAEQPKENSIKWSNSGNLFWASHDLMWTIDALLRDATKETIGYGLRQSLHHVRALGFAGLPIESKLAELTARAESTLEQDWTPQLRSSYATELAFLKDTIGDLAADHQPDFDPGPKR